MSTAARSWTDGCSLVKHELDLAGKVALVTGGSNGIGLAIARALSQSASAVAILDIKDEMNLDGQFRDAPGHVAYYRGDVTEPQGIQGVVDLIASDFRRIDILVNNAGVAEVAPIGEIEFDRWSRVIDVNLTGAVACTNAVVPHMKCSGWGRVINVSSIWALVGSQTYSAYGASKAALRQLSKIWAADLAPYGITVNSICPGWVKTSMLPVLIDRLAALHGISAEEMTKQLLRFVPQKRFLDASEVASCALFLASDLARGITGTEIVIDAGMTGTFPDGLFSRTGTLPVDFDAMKDEIFGGGPPA